jgi:thiol:disulfide interchange protein
MNRRSLIVLAAASLCGLFFTLPSTAADEFPAGSPKFETSYKAALSEAKKSGKPLIAIFSASWCAPCQVNKKKVYPSAQVKPYHDKFVWAYLNADEPANQAILKQYSAKGEIPHIQFFDKNGNPLGSEGATTAPAFAKTLAGILAKSGASAAPAKKK